MHDSCVPVVRAIGGLKDTLLDTARTRFLFEEESHQAPESVRARGSALSKAKPMGWAASARVEGHLHVDKFRQGIPLPISRTSCHSSNSYIILGYVYMPGCLAASAQLMSIWVKNEIPP
jgi:hypothetical protein